MSGVFARPQDGHRSSAPAERTPDEKSFALRIADLTVQVTAEDDLKLGMDVAAAKFLVRDATPDLEILARWEKVSPSSAGLKVFDSGGTWRLYAEHEGYTFWFTSPVFGPCPYKVAHFDRDFRAGTVGLNPSCFQPGQNVYPLEYPLDELLFLHLLASGKGVEAHACGIVDRSGQGYLCVGQSGAGKSTIARLWMAQEGARILSDDRIVLRKVNHRIWMFGTPWHGEAQYSESVGGPLTTVLFLRHGEKNAIQGQSQATVAAGLFACGFPLFYNPAAVQSTLALFDEISRTVPCYQLQFVPDATAVDFIKTIPQRYT